MPSFEKEKIVTPSGSNLALSRFTVFLLLASIFVIAACGIIYELLVGSLSSYFLGNSVEQYSLTIGFFLFSMGIGSWASRAVRNDLLRKFISIEVWLGFFGGLTVPLLYLAYSYTDLYQYCMILLILVQGILIGLEIPILTRILKAYGTLRTILSDVLSMDYLGALAAALLFPFFCLPILGAMFTSLLTGGVNLFVGAVILIAVKKQLSHWGKVFLMLHIGFVAITLVVVAWNSDALLQKWEDTIYTGRIVHNEESKYQKIVLTRWKNESRLFLNEHLQFSSTDEHRYHEALVHPAMSIVKNRERILIIGGGDGLGVREALKYEDVSHIDLVDLDPSMTDLGRRNLYLTDLNNNSLSRKQVKITNEDAFTYLQRARQPYSVIIIDLPDPREESLSKLYSVEAYRLFKRHLAKGGVLVTQATSPYYSRHAFWCIGVTLEQAGFHVYPYHAYVPSFGEWGYYLAARHELKVDGIEFKVEMRFLNKTLFSSMFFFDSDMDRVSTQPNTLDMPRLARYYRQDYAQW